MSSKHRPYDLQYEIPRCQPRYDIVFRLRDTVFRKLIGLN